MTIGLWLARPAPLFGELLWLDDIGLLFLSVTSVLFFAAALAVWAHLRAEAEHALAAAPAWPACCGSWPR